MRKQLASLITFSVIASFALLIVFIQDITHDEYEELKFHQNNNDLSYYLTYHSMEIKKQIDADSFSNESDVERHHDVFMTWADKAFYRDIDGDLIPRDELCNPVIHEVLPASECDPKSNNWIQWWEERMPPKNPPRSIEPWTLHVKTIPKNAHTIHICSDQTIEVYRFLFIVVNKHQTICTKKNFVIDRSM